MVRVSVQHLAKIQDFLKFITLAYLAVVVFDIANYLWNGYTHLLLSMEQIIAMFLIIVIGWILYLSSINSVVKVCATETDMEQVIPRENEKGALLSVYDTVSPCDRSKTTYLPEILPSTAIVRSGDDFVTGFMEVVPMCMGRGMKFPYIRGMNGSTYRVSEECWEENNGKIILGKPYKVMISNGRNGSEITYMEEVGGTGGST
jgi:hypothetical protein